MPALKLDKVPKLTVDALRSAAKLSERCRVVPPRLRQAIDKYLKEEGVGYMRRKVLRLSESFNGIKEVNLELRASVSKDLVDDPLKTWVDNSRRCKITTSYGDVGFKYQDDQTAAYVASRMPAVFSACFRVLSGVKKRVPGFSPTKVLDFGAGTGSAMWALWEVWPQSLKKINLIEPSQSMQRAGQSLIKDLENLPCIQGYNSIQALSRSIKKSEREHDLVIASYVLGEIPSMKDRITTVRQLWNLTGDILVLVEPGTPHGAKIISQMRSHILWMEKRKCQKLKRTADEAPKNFMALKSDAHIIAPYPHDGACPLDNTGKYCHFVQRLERTSSQRAYMVSTRSMCKESWPLDGMNFETLKEQLAKRKLEDLEIDYEDQFESEDEDVQEEEEPISFGSDVTETDVTDNNEAEDDENEEEVDENEEEDEEEDKTSTADLGGGWGRIIYSPFRRGKMVEMDVCRATNHDGTEGAFERVVVTQSENPTMHQQAKNSLGRLMALLKYRLVYIVTLPPVNVSFLLKIFQKARLLVL